MGQFYFNLPPFDNLNDNQKRAVLDGNAIALSGGPGTGKSVVSLWRHLTNYRKEKPIRSQLLTFTTTLALYLKSCCETQDKQSAAYVHSTLNWWNNHQRNVDEIIIDEAQDMKLDFNKRLLSITERVTYGADNQQILRPNCFNNDGSYNLAVCSPEEELQKLFDNRQHKLNRNYRSTQNIMRFAKEYFEDSFVHSDILEGLSTRIGDLPRLLVTGGDLQKQNEVIIDVIRQFNEDEANNIAVLQPFASAPYAGGESLTAKYYYNILQKQFDVSYYDHLMHSIYDIRNVHCTTFKSAKGLEFDIVLIPNIEFAKRQFKVVSWRDFFVGATRAKSQLILLSERRMPEIEKYVETVIL
jgi:DNA helicase IV